MTTTTTYLNLFKYVPSTDGNLTFSITSALNDNWDKLANECSSIRSTCSSLSSSLSYKVSTSSLVTIAGAMKTFSRTGSSGYIIYTNGWCMQWGMMPSDTNTSRTITFVKEFADNSYIVLCSEHNSTDTDTAGVDMATMSSDFTSTSFRVSVAKARPAFWMAFGVLKAGLY